MLKACQAAVKEKSETSVERLLAVMQYMNWQQFPEALRTLAMRYPDCIAAIMNKDVSTDAAMVVLYALITRMAVIATADYRVERDRAKNLLQYHRLLENLVVHKKPMFLKASQLASINSPLKMSSVSQVVSKIARLCS